MRHLIILSLCIVASSAPGCVHDCTLLYLPDQLALDFQPPPSSAGLWTLDLSGDLEASCYLVLPVAQDSDGAGRCGSGEWTLTGTDTDHVQVEAVLSDDGASILGVNIVEAAPTTLQIRLIHDDAIAADVRLTPDYEIVEPNGEGCGESLVGQEDVAVDAP